MVRNCFFEDLYTSVGDTLIGQLDTWITLFPGGTDMAVKVHDLVAKLGVRYTHHIKDNRLFSRSSPVPFTLAV